MSASSCALQHLQRRRASQLTRTAAPRNPASRNVLSCDHAQICVCVCLTCSCAQDEFFITYHGEPLTPPMVTLVTNALQYYLSLNEVAKEESY